MRTPLNEGRAVELASGDEILVIVGRPAITLAIRRELGVWNDVLLTTDEAAQLALLLSDPIRTLPTGADDAGELETSTRSGDERIQPS